MGQFQDRIPLDGFQQDMSLPAPLMQAQQQAPRLARVLPGKGLPPAARARCGSLCAAQR